MPRTLFAWALILAAAATATAEEKSIKLFDGKTLDGWVGPKDVFRVEDGAITAGNMKDPTQHNDFLCTEKEFGDFELTLKFKLMGGKTANGGVQFRTKRIPHEFEVSGYQADMGDGWWGSLYDESRRNKVLVAADPKVIDKVLKRDDWNDYRVRAEGKRIEIFLNGTKTVDYTEEDKSIPETGIIAVQIHAGPPSQVWYKNLVLKPLGEKKSADK